MGCWGSSRQRQPERGVLQTYELLLLEEGIRAFDFRTVSLADESISLAEIHLWRQ